MLRRIVGSLVCFVLVAAVALAADEKKGKTVNGKFESFTAGTLKVKAGKKGEEKTEEFKVPDDLKVASYVNYEKHDVAAKDAFKDLKAGETVQVKTDADGKVVSVTTGAAPKKTSGAFASYKDGTLTLKVKGKNGEESKEFKVTDDTKAVTLTNAGKKEATVKDALKDAKEGTTVTVLTGAKNKILGVEIGTAKKEKNK